MHQLHHHRSPDDLQAWETLLWITWHKGELYFLHWGCNSCVGPWRSHSYLLARNLIRTESTKFTCRLGDWSQKGLLCASSDWWGHFVPRWWYNSYHQWQKVLLHAWVTFFWLSVLTGMIEKGNIFHAFLEKKIRCTSETQTHLDPSRSSSLYKQFHPTGHLKFIK